MLQVPILNFVIVMEDVFVYRHAGHLSSLEDMRLRGVLCDVTIEVDRKQFQAHKFILATSTKYFENMFSTNFQEKNEKIISIEDVSANNMEALISFAYTGQITFTKENVISLTKDADYLDFVNIKEEGMKFLKSRLQAQNVYEVYCFAKALDCTDLIAESTDYMQKNFGEVSLIDNYRNFDVELLNVILSNICKDTPTTKIFDAVMRWILNDIAQKNIHLLPLLQLIKFSDLNSEFLVSYFFKDGTSSIGCKHNKLVIEVMSFYENYKQVPLKNDNCILAISHQDDKINIEIYYSLSDTWRSTTTNIICDSLYSACLLDNHLYLLKSKSAQVYDLHSKIWKNTSSYENNYSRRDFASAALDGFLYVCGGRINEGIVGCPYVERYSPECGEWKMISSMNASRYEHVVAAFQGYIYAIGGVDDDDPDYHGNLVERYDPRTDQWTMLKSHTKVARYNCGAAVLNGKLYVSGGESYDGNRLNSVEVYDPNTDSWNFVANMNESRNDHLVVAHMGKLWAIGGFLGDLYGERNSTKTVEVYDPDSDSWSYANPMKETSGRIVGVVAPSGLF